MKRQQANKQKQLGGHVIKNNYIDIQELRVTRSLRAGAKRKWNLKPPIGRSGKRQRREAGRKVNRDKVFKSTRYS